MTCDKYVGVG